jgi:NADPH:quinone reductase-like Zn-dependent oxidoreductase
MLQCSETNAIGFVDHPALARSRFRVLGARVIATTSTAEKAERLKALGASEVINYTETQDWDEKSHELTDGRGVDFVVEIGGPGTIAKSLKALAVGAHVSLIGASLSPAGTMLDPLLLTGRGITVGSISVGCRANFEAMNRAIALHRLRPVIGRTFPLAEAKAAYRHFESRGHFGKVVLRTADRLGLTEPLMSLLTASTAADFARFGVMISGSAAGIAASSAEFP